MEGVLYPNYYYIRPTWLALCAKAAGLPLRVTAWCVGPPPGPEYHWIQQLYYFGYFGVFTAFIYLADVVCLRQRGYP